MLNVHSILELLLKNQSVGQQELRTESHELQSNISVLCLSSTQHPPFYICISREDLLIFPEYISKGTNYFPDREENQTYLTIAPRCHQ